ncbi:MAG TPA: dockerin type I domain-containing protein [Planctomycetota bacterium]|nr:dockerin type I domain-containing protein [Planctomycetota bacterium]
MNAHALTDAFYVVTPVGPLPAQAGPTWAFDVNDQGTVYGVALLDGGRESRCFLWSNGTATVIAAELGHPYIWPGSINNSTDFVGTQMVTNTFGTRYEAFVGVEASLPDLFSQFPSGQASHGHDISNSVAGAPPWACGTLRQDEQIGVGAFSVFHAYLAFLDGNPNPAIAVPGLGGTFVRAEALNDDHAVVGASLTPTGALRAFLLADSAGSPTDLGTLDGTGSHSWATDINTVQQIVGWSRIADGGTRSFRFQNGVMRSLGTLGGNISEAHGLNDAGQIVGMSFNTQQKPRAFLFEGDQLSDLNTRIAADSGWRLQYAKAINESGTIVGWGRLQNETRGFVLTPRGAGDATLDGTVDANDLRAVIRAWGTHGAAPATCPADVAPLDGDGLVNEADLLAVIANWAR